MTETTPQELARTIEKIVKEHMVPFNEERMREEIEFACFKAVQQYLPSYFEDLTFRRRYLKLGKFELTFRLLPKR